MKHTAFRNSPSQAAARAKARPAAYIIGVVIAVAAVAGLFLLAGRFGAGRASPSGSGVTTRMLVVHVEAEQGVLLLTQGAQPGAASYYLCEAYTLDGVSLTDQTGSSISLAEIACGDYVDVTAEDRMLLVYPEQYEKVYAVQKVGEADVPLGQEVWQYYCDWQQSQTLARTEPEASGGVVRWEADLDHDGKAEQILFDRDALMQDGFSSLVVERADGTQLYTADLSSSHVAWNTFALYTDDAGQQYLLHYVPYLGGGAGQYWYELLSFDAEGAVVVEDTDAVEFSVGMPYNAPDNDVEKLVAFTDAVNRLWQNAVLLVTTDANVISSLYTEAGPREDDGAEYAIGTPEEPLYYTETMWWSFYLTDEVPEYAAELGEASLENLRRRLEAGNEVLARHRAEVEAQQAEE